MSDWLIDPKTTLVLIQTRKGKVSSALMLYLAQRFPIENIVPASVDDQLVVARNVVLRDHHYSSRTGAFRHFAMFDDDMIPDSRTDAMFSLGVDLAGCHYETPSPNAWLRSDDVHCGAMIVSRDILHKMKLPFFQFTYNADVTSCLGCECNYFRDKVKEAGGTIARAGYCQNLNQRSWCGPR